MTKITKYVLAVIACTFFACSDNGTKDSGTKDTGTTAGKDAGPAQGATDAPVLTEDAATEAGVVSGLTYWKDVLPIVESKCMGCHQTGGIAPFSMQTYAETKRKALSIADYVSGGIMPPYYIRHDNTCGSFDDSVALTPVESETLVSWASGSADEGTPGTVATPPVPHLEGGTDYHTPTFSPVAQGTAVAQVDEYRCFLVDPALAQDAFITGFEVTPGNTTIVHHLIGFAVDPSALGDNGQPNSAIMEGLHSASPTRDGWPCFGAAGDNVAVAGVPVEWAPGQGVVNYPPSMGFQMKRTYQYVIQVHYNLDDPRNAGQSDSSTVRIHYANAVDRRLAFFLPDAFLDTLRSGKPDALPPGQSAAVYKWRKTAAQIGLPSSLPYVDLVAVMPHMHGRGVGQEFDIEPGDGTTACAAALTRWDFHWQKFYFYKPDHYPRLTSSSAIDVACTYDTSAETSPVLPGWGTRNEMCLTILMVALPPGV